MRLSGVVTNGQAILERVERSTTEWLMKRTLPVLLVLLSGCAVGPGLKGVMPYQTEFSEAQSAIDRRYLPRSRYLAEREWRPTVDRIVNKIGPAARETCRAVGAMHCGRIGGHIEIVEDSSINAFVDSEYRVSLHSGLLIHASSDEEIAAVVAHEYGHVFANHFEKQAANAGSGSLWGGLVGLAILAASDGYIDADTASDIMVDTMSIGLYAGGLAFSQQFELESDYYAALILDNAGIDLDAGRDLLIRLARASKGDTSHGTGAWGTDARLMATTHPADDWRIARWMGVAQSIQESKTISPSGNENQLRQAALGGLWNPPIKIGNVTRWINPDNGHSGMMTITGILPMRSCQSATLHAQCIRYRQQDFYMDQVGTEVRHLCNAPKVAGDDNSWEWFYAGTEAPGRWYRDGCPQLLD